MPKVLTIGGATQDIFLHYQGSDSVTIKQKGIAQNYMLFESGEKVEISALSYYSGGGATNAATSFSRLGITASCYCSVGRDAAGSFIMQDLADENVESSLIKLESSSQTGVSHIINTIEGERTIFTFRGANECLELCTLPSEIIKSYNQIYITSLSNQSTQALGGLVSLAKHHKIPIAINPGRSQLAKGTLVLKECLQDIDILILNSNEAGIFMAALIALDEHYKAKLQDPSSTSDSCTLNTASDVPYLMTCAISRLDNLFSLQSFFRTILEMGPSIVVVTNGANGVYAASGTTAYFHPSLKVEVANTVGAGDSFGSCFVASLLLGYSIQDSLRHGIINSASVLEHLGAKTGLLTLAEIQLKTAQLVPTLLQTFKL